MKTTIICLIFFISFSVHAAIETWVDPDTGIKWQYWVQDGGARIFAPNTVFTLPLGAGGTLTIPSMVGGYPVTSTGTESFKGCSGFKSVAFPDSMTTIGQYSFYGSSIENLTIPDNIRTISGEVCWCCNNLKSVVMGSGVELIGQNAFFLCTSLKHVIFKGDVPQGLKASRILDYCDFFWCPRQYATKYINISGSSRLGGFVDQFYPATTVEILSEKIRENDSSIIDVVYLVKSPSPKAKVRVLAFEDGERSFAKVIRPESLVCDVEGNPTESNIGDEIETNVPHTLSWKVSDDWGTRLAKFKVVVLARVGELLPLELRTIPASDQFGSLEFSWNVMPDSQVFDALMWLYAAKEGELTLSNGLLRNGSTDLANGTSINEVYATRYVLGKMGFNLLEGAVLNYVNSETRLNLQPSGARQYGYRIIEE